MEIGLDQREIQVWIMGLAEARNELDDDQFEGRVGLSLDSERELSRRLVAARDGGTSEPIKLLLTEQELHATYRALKVAMEGLGKVDFETIVGQTWEFGQRSLARLRELVMSVDT